MLAERSEETFHLNNSQISEPAKKPLHVNTSSILNASGRRDRQFHGKMRDLSTFLLNAKSLALWNGHVEPNPPITVV